MQTVSERMTILHWRKKLSKSDAQQKTRGAKMPFLRLTKSGMAHDHTTWFRHRFFDTLNWAPAGGGQAEQARVAIRVVIDGQDRGRRYMTLDHDPKRPINHNAPTTHLHYDHATRRELEGTNLTGRIVVLQRDGQDYFFEIL